MESGELGISQRPKKPSGFLVAAGALIAFFFILDDALGGASFDETVAAYRSSDAVLVDRYGEPLYEIRVDQKSRKLPWSELNQISVVLQNAVIDAEDRRFQSHSGVDYRAAFSAFFRKVVSAHTGETVRGASTISMQVAALLRADLMPAKNRRTVLQKYRQGLAAEDLEKAWSKPQILEAYLNLIPFRGEVRGITAASWSLFEKAPSGLGLEESRILAALIRSPNAAPSEVARRARSVLENQLPASDWTPERVNVLLNTNSSLRRFFDDAPHVARQAKVYYESQMQLTKAPLKSLASTLDRDIQRVSSQALGRVVDSLRERNVTDGAVLVVDNESGEVLAYVGNIQGKSKASYVDGVRALRQAGSTLKPFIYAQAFEQKILTPTSIIEDQPLQIAHVTGLYSPQNYNKKFAGDVEAKDALASSLNIPAVKVLMLLGIETFRDRLEKLGVSNLREGVFYGPALALGAIDVSLWELVAAYRALARGGLYSPLVLFGDQSNSVPPERVFSQASAFVTSDILADRQARSSTFGLENNLTLPFWAAVKTGTSKDMRDNWCVGFSTKYTVGVWVGNFNGESMWDVSGVDGAAPVWREVLIALHRGLAPKSPSPPSSVVRLAKLEDAGHGQESWYIKGTSPSRPLESSERLDAKISYPPDGTILAIDPDIPINKQRVALLLQGSKSDLNWYVDGTAAAEAHWVPVQGRHSIEIRANDGRVVDAVNIVVR